jgi:hypothetical protein
VTLGLAARWGPALSWGLAALGAEYGVHFSERGTLDEVTPLYAAAFLLTAELAFWSIEPRVPAWSEASVAARRFAFLIGTCAGAAALAAVVLVLAAASGGGGVALEAVGVAAVIGSLILLAVLVRPTLPAVDSET